MAKSLNLFEPQLATNKVDVISTKMNIIIDGNPSVDDFVFVPFFADFKSKNKPQIFLIDTSALNSVKNMSISGLNFEQKHVFHIDRIHIDDGSDFWPEVKHDAIFSGEINTIMILFKMPANAKTAAFKFYVKVKVDGRASTFDCDPQVGNDPPQ